MLVREMMTARVVRVKPDTPVKDALRLMLEHRVDGLPVVDDRNQVVGILTYADLLREGQPQHPYALDFFFFAHLVTEASLDAQQRFQRMLQCSVWDLCTEEVVVCHPDDELARAAELMVRHGVKRLPVISEQGVLAGIISRSDIMRAIWQSCSQDSNGNGKNLSRT